MKDFLFASCPPMLWVISLLELVFTVLLFSRFAKTKNRILLLSGMICVGLTYDALILALGSFMQEGTLLLALSRLRYVFHGGLIPLIFLICAIALDFKGFWEKAAWVFTGVLVVLGIADGELQHYDTGGEEIDANWYTKDEVRRLIREEHFGSWAQAYCYMGSREK